MKVVRKILKVLGILTGTLAGLAVCGILVLTFTEYKPADVEAVTPVNNDTAAARWAPGDTLSIVTWNCGYGALGDNADFFMDGGQGVRTADKPRVEENMKSITDRLAALSPDIAILQEVDVSSTRSHRIDETQVTAEALAGRSSAFATNYKVLYVPYPIPTIGQVHSGIQTLSAAKAAEASRIQLPCPFSWPIRLANLKRCLLVTRYDLEGTDQQLVVVNFHLEAYDDGEGKAAQTEKLVNFLKAEAEQGHYVIAGGDFNQCLERDGTSYPYDPELWTPGTLDWAAFDAAGLTVLADPATPTCRSLDRPYDRDDPDFIHYVIDGFIVSANVEVQGVETIDAGFTATDHNPVRMTFRLIPKDGE